MNGDYRARDHWFDLIQQGRRVGASSGEKRARRIALSLCENLPGLDSEAVQGLHEFIDLLLSKPTTVRDMIR